MAIPLPTAPSEYRLPTRARPGLTARLHVLRCMALAGAAFPLLGTLHASDIAEPPPQPLTFERHIRPLLKHHCVHCHGEGEKLKGGLDVRLRRFLVGVVLPLAGSCSLLIRPD